MGIRISQRRRRGSLRVFLLACAIVLLGQGHWPHPLLGAGSTPLDGDQILQLLIGGDPPHWRVAELVKKHGIDFVPTEDYLQILREAGAGDGLIKTLQEGKPRSKENAPTAAPQQSNSGGGPSPMKALDAGEILSIIKGSVPDDRVLQILHLYGVTFHVTDEFLQALKTSGADEKVMDGVRAARQVAPYSQAEVPPRVIVAKEVMLDKIVSARRPVYPPFAEFTRIQGIVWLKVIIDKDGKVKHSHIITGHPLLVTAAVVGVSFWRFKPTLVQTASGNLTPVEVVTKIDVHFTQ